MPTNATQATSKELAMELIQGGGHQRTAGVVPGKQYSTADQLMEDLAGLTGQQHLGGDMFVRPLDGGIVLMRRREGQVGGEIMRAITLDAGQLRALQAFLILAEAETLIEAEMETIINRQEETAARLSRLRGGCLHNDIQRCERCTGKDAK